MAMKFASRETQAQTPGQKAGQVGPFFTEAPESAPRAMAERFCTERRFISGNAAAAGFASSVEAMLKSPEFGELLRNVTKTAREYGKSPSKALSEEDRRLLLNFRVNFNAVLNDSTLRKVLVRCAEDPKYSGLMETAKQINSDKTVKAGFDRVTRLVSEDEKFKRSVRALWELKSFL
ncbi:MAG: hypothetical protein WC861_02080 [Candidatus Micrarchaeia archaeon]|jgi:hypothetical protein